MSLLQIENLTVADQRNGEIIVDNISFSLEANSCLGIVGESGSGKSMTAKALLGLTNPWLSINGKAFFGDIDIIKLKGEGLRKIRGRRICMIPQDAMTAFDPLYTIGYQMIETIVENVDNTSKDVAREIVIAALDKLCINDSANVMKKYPHQLSGGMLQRCMIAITLCVKPDIIIADEPTTALDSINQREVVEEFQRLKEITETSIIFISHDLGIINHLANYIIVMKNGKLIERGTTEEVFCFPKHEYTKYLIDTRLELTQRFQQSMGWRK